MLQLKTDPFPTLNTERLVLREITMDDVEAVFAIRSDERVMQYIGKPRAKDIKDSVELIERVQKGREESSSITWGITTKSDPKLIGMIGYYRIQLEHYRGEIGYALHAD
ncbi:MAG: GNAT family N-acetyltransferase, partial [Flavobacteriales bacterium]